MHYNSLKTTQVLKVSVEEAWEFFSNPKNLATITPDEMRFLVTSEPEDHIYTGQIITYIVRPLLGIPMKWMTEIQSVEAPHRFVDSQLVGPYTLWHHQHNFEEIDEGTLMTDLVHYSISPWKFGRIADALFVRKQLEKVFDYRFQKVEELFNKKSSPSHVKTTV